MVFVVPSCTFVVETNKYFAFFSSCRIECKLKKKLFNNPQVKSKLTYFLLVTYYVYISKLLHIYIKTRLTKTVDLSAKCEVQIMVLLKM